MLDPALANKMPRVVEYARETRGFRMAAVIMTLPFSLIVKASSSLNLNIIAVTMEMNEGEVASADF